MNAPTREMIAAGVRKLGGLKRWLPPDDVLVETIWFAMDEERTKWEHLKTENISPSDA